MQSTIVCRFLNELDTSIKSCVVMYGQCGQELNQTIQRNSTVEDPSIISLPVKPGGIDCYVVTASSGSFTVILDLDNKIESKGILNNKLMYDACLVY